MWPSVYCTIGLLATSQAMANIAKEHMSVDVTKAGLRIGASLQLQLMNVLLQRSVVVDDDGSNAPAHMMVHEMGGCSWGVAAIAGCPALVLAGLELVGRWAVLEWMVHEHVGTITLVVCAIINGSVGLLRVTRTRTEMLWGSARAKTVRWLFEYIMWALPVKLYAWESKLLDRVVASRQVEDALRRRMLVAEIIKDGCRWGSHLGCVGLIYVVCLWHKIEMTPVLVFTVPVFTHVMNAHLLEVFKGFTLIPALGQAAEALETIFHQATSTQQSGIPQSGDGDIDLISLDRATVVSDSKPLLLNVSLHICRGELILLRGAVGSGKSTLLRVFLGAHPIQAGCVTTSSSLRIAYCAQEHWLQARSIKDNILFGAAFDQHKYLAVLDACGLSEDLQAMVMADQNVVERFRANLSGGQKARVALARACYADADLYLLDCTLDNLDPVVQLEVFDKCIRKLLRHKTIVLVTHNPELMSSRCVDRVLELRDATLHHSRGRVVTNSAKSQRVRLGSWRASDIGTSLVLPAQRSQIGLAFCALAIATVVAFALSSVCVMWTLAAYASELFSSLAMSVISAPLNYFDDVHIGDLLHRLWQDLSDGDIH
ncbi:TPA: hypothetical protein N0F65_000512 [Lagenidium giganteum]|uniref:ABC transporter domain-containing protein n=1 Tax=Lagenidium giganteum TaxID=4803 RepID=A0AAV2YY76_9STRA|nr:TPA: hypothetical protein N0F65_000512 [Lagenidium giganteum]